jgi:hypothetical protein
MAPEDAPLAGNSGVKGVAETSTIAMPSLPFVRRT